MVNKFDKFKLKRFTCLECGECCTAWNLPVREELYEKIIELDWVKSILKKENVEFKVNPENIFLPKKDKICIFKDNNNLCLLQKNNGIEYKPIECQRFPFAFARDHEGKIYTDTSFFCKAIIKNKGVELTEFIQEEYAKKYDCFELPEQINLTFSKKTTFKELQKIRYLVNTYLFENCMCSNIEEWPQFFLNTYKYIENYSPKNKIQDQKFKTSNLKKALLSSIFLRKRNIVPDLFKLLMRSGTILEPIIAESINLTTLKTIKIPEDNELKETFLRYLLDIAERNILYAHKHSFQGILLIAIFAYYLTLWYSKALALIELKDSTELFHIELAIRIMERYYIGHNVRFMENFRSKGRVKILQILCL